MSFYWLAPEDSNTGPLFYENDGPRLTLRDQYGEFACAECHKLDQFQALSSIGPPPRFVSQRCLDYQCTADGLVCMSIELFQLFNDIGKDIPLAFELPGDPEHVVVWPTSRAHVDIEKSTARLNGPQCPKCGRYKDVTIRPDSSTGITPPHDVENLFGLDINPQGRHWELTHLYMNAPQAFRLKGMTLTGLTLRECKQYPRQMYRPLT